MPPRVPQVSRKQKDAALPQNVGTEKKSPFSQQQVAPYTNSAWTRSRTGPNRATTQLEKRKRSEHKGTAAGWRSTARAPAATRLFPPQQDPPLQQQPTTSMRLGRLGCSHRDRAGPKDSLRTTHLVRARHARPLPACWACYPSASRTPRCCARSALSAERARWQNGAAAWRPPQHRPPPPLPAPPQPPPPLQARRGAWGKRQHSVGQHCTHPCPHLPLAMCPPPSHIIATTRLALKM